MLDNIKINEEAKNRIKKLFNLLATIYSDPIKQKGAEFVIYYIEEETASNKNFYDNTKEAKEYREQIKKKIFGRLNINDDDVFNLIKIELESPFGIFYPIFELDVPDMIIQNRLIKLQYANNEFLNVSIPLEIKEIFSKFLDHLINLQKYINELKFDISQAIVDSTFEIFRLNMVHQSLSVFNTPTITIRKHITNIDMLKKKDAAIFNKNEYEKSLNISKEQLNKIKEASMKSFIIFGETGSGKTTMLRYLIQNDFQKKRNVCIIEDSAELFIDTNISLITNRDYTIHDLFVATLRQNPSHLIIGETRTAEIVDILESALTFSIGTTIHANSLEKAIERIYFMSRSRNISKSDIIDLISASINMFIWMDNKKIAKAWIKNNKRTASIFDMYDEII